MRMAGGDSLSFLLPQAPAFSCRLKGLPVAVLQASVYNQTIIASTYFCSVSTELVQSLQNLYRIPVTREERRRARRQTGSGVNSFLLPERQGSVKWHHLQDPQGNPCGRSRVATTGEGINKKESGGEAGVARWIKGLPCKREDKNEALQQPRKCW